MRLRFGEFTFDSDTRELLRDRQPVTLSPKAFQLLEILIDSRPKALTKSALHDRLWPETFVVEANLSNLVGEIRRALGDDSYRPEYVRTVHRFGYAFRGETADASPLRTPGAVCRVAWEHGSATLGEGEHIIGRDFTAAVILDSPSVSRRHACIRVTDGEATFEDLGSKNGSSVAGHESSGQIRLADGDVITVGIVKLTFRIIQPTVPTESIR